MRYVQKLKTHLKVIFLLFVLNSVAINHLLAQNPCTDCRQSDSLALVALYNATNGASWVNHTNWLTIGKNLDTWFGVSLSGTPARVTYINLPSNNLNGNLPPELAKLSHLERFYVNDNFIQGMIPPELRSMINGTLFVYFFRNLFIFSDFSNFTSVTNPYIRYSPQKAFDVLTKTYVGKKVIITSSDNHPFNHYTWYIDGNPLIDHDSVTYSFVPTKLTEVNIEIRNDILTNTKISYQNLIIRSKSIYVEPPQIQVVVNIVNPDPVCEPSKIDLTSPNITAGSTANLSFTYFSSTGQLSNEEATSINVSGTYYIKGTDENGLSDTKPVQVVINPKPILLGQMDAVTCPGGSNGRIDLSVSVGKSPYSFNWSNGASTEDISNLSQNTYDVSVTDANMCVASASFNVEQKDSIIPNAIAQDIIIQLDSSGKALVTPDQVNNGSNDNCEIKSFALSKSYFDCSNIGNNTVTLTITDLSGNVSSANAVVTVEDIIPPVALAQNITVQLDATGSASITTDQINKGSSDNCGIASLTVSPSSFNCSNVGNNTVTLTVTDKNGNVSSANAVVTVEDIIPPVALTQNITVELDATGSASIIADQINKGSSDNCGIASLTVSPSSFNCSNVGNNTVTLTVTDKNGNVSSANAVVTVEDIIPPVALTQNITVQLDATGSAFLTADQINKGSSDNCGIASLTVSPSSFNCGNVGNNTVTLTVTDKNGNVSSANAVVTVEDIIPPVALAQNITVQLDATGSASIIADQINKGSSDNCGITSLTVSPSSFNCSNVGNNTVTLTVTDKNGNVSSANAVVTVEDIIPPVALTQNITVELDATGSAFISADQINKGSSDNCGIASLTVSPSSFNCSNVGNNTVTLNVTDKNGNVSSANAVVTVEDIIPPLALAQNITVQLDPTGSASIIADQINKGSSDNCGIASLTVSPSSFNCSNVGNNTVTLTVTDKNGNVSSANAVVTVEDIIPPVALTQNITVQLDATGSASITADQINKGSSDNCGIASLTVSPSSFNCGNVGNNTVTLTTTDKNGNVSSANAVVTVEDIIPPVALAQNITVQLDPTGSASITPDQINNGSSDACGIASIEVLPATFNCSNVGTNNVTLIVKDKNGNISTANSLVTVEDITAPVAVAHDITVQLNSSGVVSITASQIDNGSSDACGIKSMTVSPSEFGYNQVGYNNVILTVTDKNGNVSTTNAIVSVLDRIPPTAAAQGIIAPLDSTGSVTITADQIDNGSYDASGIASKEISKSSFNCGNVGPNFVTLKVTDLYGNVSTDTAIVVVVDNIAPVVLTRNITVQLNATGSASITAAQINNGSYDICGIASYSVSPSTFDCSKVGANSVTLTVKDVNGNVSTANAIVTVEDKIAPVAIAKNITVQLDATGSVSITAAQINNGSSDVCGIASYTVTPSTFDCSKVGANSVTLTVKDVNGNVSSAKAIVTVEDKIAPSIIAPSSITLNSGTGSSDHEGHWGCEHSIGWEWIFGLWYHTGCGQNSGSCQKSNNVQISCSNQNSGGTYCGSKPSCGNGNIDLGTPVVSDNCTVKTVTNNAPSVFPTGLTVVTWTVTDVNGNSSSATQNVTITNNGGTANKIPVILSISSNSPVYILNYAEVTALFSDDNLTNATWNWGDGTSSSGTILGQQIKGSHKYRETGIYDVNLTIKDAYNKTATMVYSYIVVFDIGCGDVTGGGWIDSKKGDYRLKSICDKANFGFVAQYDKQMNVKGNLTFHLNSAKFDLKSTDLEWLLIDDDHAIFKGSASVNNVDGYEFMASAIDVDIHSGCHRSNDLLRIIVWNENGDVVYDNESGDGIMERPGDQIGSGSIVIHRGTQKCSDNFKSLDISDAKTEVTNTELFANLKVYPNPASKILYVEIPERIEQAVSFDIVDVTGRIITRDVNLQLWGQNGWINLEPYPMKPGFYILKLKEMDGTQSSMFRFMKQ